MIIINEFILREYNDIEFKIEERLVFDRFGPLIKCLILKINKLYYKDFNLIRELFCVETLSFGLPTYNFVYQKNCYAASVFDFHKEEIEDFYNIEIKTVLRRINDLIF